MSLEARKFIDSRRPFRWHFGMLLPTRSDAQSRLAAIFGVVLFFSATLAVVVWIATARAAGDDWEGVADSTVETTPRDSSPRIANPPAISQGGAVGDTAGK